LATSSFFITRSDLRVIWRNRDYQKLGILSRWGDCNPAITTLGRSFTNRKCVILPPTSRRRSDTTTDDPPPPPPPPTHPFQRVSRLAYATPVVPAPPEFPITAAYPFSHSDFPVHNSHAPIMAFATRNLPSHQWMFIPPPFSPGTLALTMPLR